MKIRYVKAMLKEKVWERKSLGKKDENNALKTIRNRNIDWDKAHREKGKKKN